MKDKKVLIVTEYAHVIRELNKVPENEAMSNLISYRKNSSAVLRVRGSLTIVDFVGADQPTHKFFFPTSPDIFQGDPFKKVPLISTSDGFTWQCGVCLEYAKMYHEDTRNACESWREHLRVNHMLTEEDFM